MTQINKQLLNAYDKKLQALHKANFLSFNNNLEYFVTYLKYMRDYYLLTDAIDATAETTNLKTASLVTAISEYEKYTSCITNYYKLDGNAIKKITDESEEEVSKKYNNEKKFHWMNFWQLVMTNIEDWGNNG